MDSRKGSRYYHRGYKSSGSGYQAQQYGRNGCDLSSKFGFYKTSRSLRSTYKTKSNYTYKKNFHSNYSQNLNSRREPPMKSNPVPEDPEEEERRRKLSDTASRLLNKLKTWSAESNLNLDSNKSGDDSSRTSVNCDLNSNSIDRLGSEFNGRNNNQADSLVNSERKTRRIAHSKSQHNLIGVKKTVPKLSKSRKNLVIRTRRYDVNKATVKDFQNRIQHKLINDIMQMPKESLQNVLNDPKINPFLEVKMSHLVRENKLLIAQKLRALAESKMTPNDLSTNSLLLVDIDKLIDPVIETDLSVLPYELIKQMENIFQVEFDYSNVRNSCERESQTNTSSDCASSDDMCQMPSENSAFEDHRTNLNLVSEVPVQNSLSNENVRSKTSTGTSPFVPSNQSLSTTELTVENTQKTESMVDQFKNEDFTFYECSTDEDEGFEQISCPISKRHNQRKNSSHGVCDNSSRPQADDKIPVRNSVEKSKRKSALNHESVSKRSKKNKAEVKYNRRTAIVNHMPEGVDMPNTHLVVSKSKPFKNAVGGENSNDSSPEQDRQYSSLFSSPSQFQSTGCQTVGELKNVEVQTSNELCESSTLYGVPLPRLVNDGNSDSLLEEVTSIQNLINKLNERRFMIFLQLAKSNPSGSFINNEITADSFTETLSNGNVDLVDSLKNFFARNKLKKKHIQTFNDDLNKRKKKNRKSQNEKGNGD